MGTENHKKSYSKVFQVIRKIAQEHKKELSQRKSQIYLYSEMKEDVNPTWCGVFDIRYGVGGAESARRQNKASKVN